MPIVRLKTHYREQKQREAVNGLMEMFNLASVDYTNGYQAKPRPEPVGGSSSATVGSYQEKQIKELLGRFIFR